MNPHPIRLFAAALLAAVLLFTISASPTHAQRGIGDQRGVTLYEDGDFRGDSELIIGDISDLRRTRIGSDRASSIRVDPGCRAILYTDADYRGRSMELTSDLRSLNGTAVGNDSISSIRVDCRRGRPDPPPRPAPIHAGAPGPSGATLFWRIDFHGRSQFFDEGHPNLGSTPFGQDQASSIILDPGCQVTLYSETGYRGRSTTLTGNERQLGRTPVGDNTVRSIQVSCR